jgi:hypothetical protein
MRGSWIIVVGGMVLFALAVMFLGVVCCITLHCIVLCWLELVTSVWCRSHWQCSSPCLSSH